MTNAMQPKPKPQRKAVSMVNRLTDVASVFAMACTDPWSEVCNSVCMPTMSSGASYKVRVIKRFIMTTGTQDYGYVAFAPCPANNSPTAAYTTSAFTGSAISLANTTTGVAVVSLDKCPYDTTALTTLTGASSASSRIVSYGIKCNYIGTEVNKGGVYYRYVSLDRDTVSGFDATTLGSLATCAVRPIDRQEMVAVVTPANPHEINYSNDDITTPAYVKYPYSNGVDGSATTVPAIGCIYVNSKAGNTFEIQICEHIEYIGKGPQPFMTESRSDIVGFENILSAVGKINSTEPGADARVRLPQLLRRVLQQRGISLSPRVENGIRSFVYGARMGGSLVTNVMGSARSFRNQG